MASCDNVMGGKSNGHLTFLAAMATTQLAFGGGMHPEVADHAMVASVHDLASRAGARTGADGGNILRADRPHGIRYVRSLWSVLSSPPSMKPLALEISKLWAIHNRQRDE